MGRWVSDMDGPPAAGRPGRRRPPMAIWVCTWASALLLLLDGSGVAARKRRRVAARASAPTTTAAAHQQQQLHSTWGREEPVGSEGGWQRWRNKALEGLECSFHRRSAAELTPGVFDREVRHQQPVIVSAGLLSSWGAMKRWRKAELLRHYGE
jgi:hypothetical protein